MHDDDPPIPSSLPHHSTPTTTTTPTTATTIVTPETTTTITATLNPLATVIPPRASSPPLPPRKNTLVFPPAYTSHLRNLIHQFFEQQIKIHSGLPTPTSSTPNDNRNRQSEDSRQWDGVAVSHLEKALWEGAVVPQPPDSPSGSSRSPYGLSSGGRRGLLELDWTKWAPASARRRAAHKAAGRNESSEMAKAALPVTSRTTSSKASISEADPSRLSVPVTSPPIGSNSSSLMATPKRGQGRTESWTSSSRSPVPNGLPRLNVDALSNSDVDVGEALEEWCRVISGLEGYEPLFPSRKDDWEVIDDHFSPAAGRHRDLPGAFPQGDFTHQEHSTGRSMTTASPSVTRFHDAQPHPSLTSEMVKPVFCLQFLPSIHPSPSTLTVNSHREGSVGTESVGSIGSASGKRWWGSGSLSTKFSDPSRADQVDVKFIEGKFALPSPTTVHRRGRSTTPKKSSSIRGHKPPSSTTSDDDGENDNDEDSVLSGAETGSWSDAQMAGPRSREDLAVNVVVSGGQNDIPRDEPVRVVGGTIVVRGIFDQSERNAMERIIRVLLYTIESMAVELDLLDAFRIPRELDPIPIPPARIFSPRPNEIPPPGSPGDIQRRLSGRERGERVKGFLHRFTRDSRGVLDGLLGKSRPQVEVEQPSNTLERVRSLPVPDDAVSFRSLRLDPSLLTPPIEAAPQETSAVPLHLQILSRLERIRPSTTPGLVIPMPPLLLRLRDEDRARRERVVTDVASAAGENPGSGTVTPLLGVPESKSRALYYRVGSDMRTGLAALDSSPDSFEGWIRLQKLDTLYAVGVDDSAAPVPPAIPGEATTGSGVVIGSKSITLCQVPAPISFIYYDERFDTSISSFISNIVEEFRDDDGMAGCSRQGCGALTTDHTRWWVHGGRRVGAKIRKLHSGAEKHATQDATEKQIGDENAAKNDIDIDETTTKNENEKVDIANFNFEGSMDDQENDSTTDFAIDVWVGCAICGAASEPRNLGEVASHYSWGKFLEILMYTSFLVPSICSHTNTSSSPISTAEYHLRSRAVWITISCSSVPVLDARLPKLQVGPNVPKRKPGVVAATAAMENLSPAAIKERSVEEVREDIERFFVGLEQRIAVLRVRVQEVAGAKDDASKPTFTEPSPKEIQKSSLGLESIHSAQSYSVQTVSDQNGSTTQELPLDKSILSEIPHLAFSTDGTYEEPGSETKESELASSSEPSSPDLIQSLSDLSAEFRHMELALYDVVTATPPGQLNDARRALAQQIQAGMSRLTAWQKEHGVDESFGGVPLTKPDYITDPKVFILPGSAVLVREDEPSSLIAYTISSLSYFTELAKTSSDELTKDVPAVSTGDPGDAFTVEIKRRETPRDLLSLRSLAKKRTELPTELSQLVRPPTILGPSGPSTSLVEVTHEQAEGTTQSGDMLGDLVRTISKATAADPILSVKARRPSMSESDSIFGSRQLPLGQLGPPSSLKLGKRRVITDDSDASLPPSSFRAASIAPMTSIRPTTISTFSDVTPVTPNTARNSTATGWGSSVTSSFTNSFNNLVRFGTDVSETLGSIKIRSGDRGLSSLIRPINIMSSMDNGLTNALEDRPHIQFDYTLADRVKLSCTVYHAAAYDSLRRRCAIDKTIGTSLSRCVPWDAQGGKSKASFFITEDKKYIVKELVSKWNVSDTHALLEISPAYFRHLANSNAKPSSLAKIIGFYTVRTHDLQTHSKGQLDLLVMENLFYNQMISQTYDLKGIEGRKVPKAGGTTLFDGEWLEGQQKSPIMLHPYAKRIVTEAIVADIRFLSSQSIMDYSLLLGLDETRNELVLGLVDAIGSYNLFKTIESRGKLALNRGGEVTIIPPDQYRERFENAIKQYFVACPDKWSKTNRRGITVDTLPSVM